MLPDCLRRKKTKNVCGVFWLPCLPCENDVKRSKILTPALSKGEGAKTKQICD